jgi:hypothetical protein
MSLFQSFGQGDFWGKGFAFARCVRDFQLWVGRRFLLLGTRVLGGLVVGVSGPSSSSSCPLSPSSTHTRTQPHDNYTAP